MIDVSIAQAEFAYFQKDFKKAEKYIYQALKESQLGQSIYIEIYAFFLQLRISVMAGDYYKSASILNQQRQLVKQIHTLKGYAAYDIAKGWFYSQLGELEKVPSWIKDEAQSLEVLTPITFAADKLVRARTLLHNKDIYKLLALLNNQSEGFAFESTLFGKIEILVIKSIALSLVKELEASAKIFTEAYELAKPNKIIMPFIENGKYTRTLINQLKPYLNIPSDWIKDIQTKSNTYAKQLSKIAADLNINENTQINKSSLSPRETEILTYLCQNLTRLEIADSCGLSPKYS